MKIVIYSGTIPSTTFIERLIIGLAERKVDVILHGKRNAPVRYRTANVKVLGYRGELNRLWIAIKCAGMFTTRKPITFLKLLRRYPHPFAVRSFLNWFARTGPVVWQEPDIFHLQWVKGVEDWIFLQDFGIRIVVSFRGAHINISPLADEGLANTYERLFQRIDGYHAVCRSIELAAMSYGPRPDAGRVIYSGLDLKEFEFATNKPRMPSHVEIISVGRPHWKKGHHYALDALRILKDKGVSFRYLIVGGCSEEIQFQIHDLGLVNEVSIEGMVSNETAKALVSKADILLLASVEEGIPNVILEAMALGTVVVSTDCGGVREVIDDGLNGFIVPVRDAEALASKIVTVLESTDTEIEQVRMHARKTIEQSHSKQTMISEMIGLYQDVLSRN